MGGAASTGAATGAPGTPPAARGGGGGRADAGAVSPGVGAETPPALRDFGGGGGRAGSSIGSIVPTVFAWAAGGQAVYVTGAWDKWAAKVPLARSGNEFTAVLSLPVGTYQYKFVVDGNWKHSPALTTETDANGNLNNIVHVNPCIPEFDSNLPPSGAGGPPSPVESYDYSMGAPEDYAVEPMALPQLFKGLYPDPPPPSVPPARLNPSAYVALNHTYAVAPSFALEPLRTIATVTRYKGSKFVTTVLVLNATAAAAATAPVAVPNCADVPAHGHGEQQLRPHRPAHPAPAPSARIA